MGPARIRLQAMTALSGVNRVDIVQLQSKLIVLSVITKAESQQQWSLRAVRRRMNSGYSQNSQNVAFYSDFSTASARQLGLSVKAAVMF